MTRGGRDRVGDHLSVEVEDLAQHVLGEHLGRGALGGDAAVAHGDQAAGVAGGQVDKPELLKTVDGLPYEKIAGLQPDLILATDNYELADIYDRLAQIAPTVSYVEGVNSDTWQQRVEVLGTALGRGDQAEKVITDTENNVKQAARRRSPGAGRSLDVAAHSTWPSNSSRSSWVSGTRG